MKSVNARILGAFSIVVAGIAFNLVTSAPALGVYVVNNSLAPVVLASGGAYSVTASLAPVSLASEPPIGVLSSLAPVVMASGGPVTASLAPVVLASAPALNVLASLAPVSVTASLAPVSVTASVASITLAQAPAAAALADATSNPTTTLLGAFNQWWNGATWDRGYSGSAANLGTTSAVGSGMVSAPGDWSVTSQDSGSNGQATTTKAAGGAGVRWVITGIYGSLINDATSVGTPSLTAPALELEFGSTTVWQLSTDVEAVAGDKGVIAVSGLNIVGPANTAAEVFFSGADGSHIRECVSMTGHSAQ